MQPTSWRDRESIGRVTRRLLQHANWDIRHWSAILADYLADDETLRALTPLLHDPRANVRVRNGPNPLDVILSDEWRAG
jgi:hypothetical protein